MCPMFVAATYSERIPAEGATLAARTAGTMQAASAVTNMNMVTAANVSPSVALTPYRRLEMPRPISDSK